MNKVNMQSFKGRERARRFAMQALYSWVVANHDIKDVEKFYRADRNPKNYDEAYFIHLINAVAAQTESLDSTITPYLDREFDEVDPIALTILRIATFELQNSFDVPFKVVIHEAVDLAKVFGADDCHKFINKVLDKMAKIMRSSEVEPLTEACGG